APRLPVCQRPTRGQIAVDRIMRGSLIGHGVGAHPAPYQLGQYLGSIADHADGDRLARATRALDDREPFVEVLSLYIEIARLEPHLDARRLAFDRKQRGPGHGGGERLCASHAAEPRGEDPFSGKIAAIMMPADL